MNTAMITGTNRGLGLEFTRQYLDSGWQVIACCRNPLEAKELQLIGEKNDSLKIVQLDVANFSAIDELAKELNGQPIDLLINNAGVFGPKIKADNDPRQTLGFMDYDLWADIFKINTMAPLKMAESFYENIQSSEHKKIVNLSSLVGSFVEGQSELFAYRTSKAALNMITKILSDKTPETGVISVAFSPGWVQTDMGGPQADIDVNESISGLKNIIANLSKEDSGSFLNYDGRMIPW